MKKDRKQIRLKRKEKENPKEILKDFYLNPMLPRKYNYLERKKLREFEKEILKDYKGKIDIENTNMLSSRLSRKQKEDIKRKESEMFQNDIKKLTLNRNE